MNIDWNKLHCDDNYIKIKKEKDFLYDMIIGELNRISVSDDFNEKSELLTYLRKNIEKYYNKCVVCTDMIMKCKRGDNNVS